MRRLHWMLTGLLLSITACAQPTTDTVDSITDESTNAVTIGSASTDADDHDQSAHAHAGLTDHLSGQESHSSRHQTKHGGHGGNGGHAAVKRTDGLAIGDVVPDFEVSIDGQPQTLSQLRKNKDITEDGTLVLTFWCSFCHSCRDVEMDLNELAAKYTGTVGVIAIDASAGETTKGIAAFAKKKGLTLPIAITNGSVADLFGIRVTTTTVIIDSNGVLRYCGQFADQQHSYAADALAAVLSESDVAVPETAHRG